MVDCAGRLYGKNTNMVNIAACQERGSPEYPSRHRHDVYMEPEHVSSDDVSQIKYRQKAPPCGSPDSQRSPSPPAGCAGCGGKIIDRYYLMAVDRQWHLQCLVCTDCQIRLESDLTCFHRDGQIFCKEDYYRRFGCKQCVRCASSIGPNELVMKARENVYHVQCFVCTHCQKTLTPGDYYGLKDGLIFCRSHYELVMAGEYMPTLSPTLPGGHPGAQLPFYNGVGTVQKGRPRKRKTRTPDPDCMGLGGMGDGELGLDYQSAAARQKRMRTSFKHHQLRTMKSYFALNHNPDAKDLKQLAQKTALTKRVLQVWFQNARAKYRRNILRQESQGGDKKAGSLSDSASMADGMSNPRSPAMSDISSSPSLSDLPNSSIDQDHSSTGSLSELFTAGMSEVN